MQLSKRQIFLIVVAVVSVGLVIFFFISNIKGPSPDGPGTKKTQRLVIWGVDSPQAFSTVKQNYETLHKEVAVNYVQVGEGSIQQQLVQALANNQGPDIVMIKNRTLPRQRSLLLAAPPTKMSLSSLRRFFPTVVEQDFSLGGQIYALPLYVDTLALIYNKDFFDQARIIAPPQTWSELVEIVPQLVKTGQGGQFERAAIGLGGSGKTVTNVGDILPLLFMQNNIDLSRGRVDPDSGAGRSVLDFYLQFSNPRSLSYTWSDIQTRDLQSFANLKTAMVIAYKKQLAQVKRQNNFLNYRVSMMPQANSSKVDYADYWGLAVSRGSKQSALAWDFILYATTVSQNAQAYAKATGYPPALLTLARNSFEDPEMGPFAQQALTARSWRSPDDSQTREIFSDVVSSYLAGQANIGSALGRAQNQLSQLLR